MKVCLRSAVLAAAAVVLSTHPARAQQRRAQVGRSEVPWLDFSPDGAWRRHTREVRARREALLRSGSLQSLNAGGAALRITGTFTVPVVLISYTNVAIPFDTTSYKDVLFNPNPSTRPYSVKTYYEETSRGAITLNGKVFNPVIASNIDTYYEDGCHAIGVDNFGRGVSCNHPGLSGTSARLSELLLDVLGKADNGVDWGLFDNDGPDGVPNSPDDDGFVDFISFIQPEVDGACGGNPNLWSHRFTIAGVTGSNYTTKTPRSGGGFIRIRDYTLQSGRGGDTACDNSQIMPIGTIAHETGHAFGLPDLYDTSLNTEGIGEWGIMGSGNYARPYSPAGYDAWSLTQLGWVTVDTLSSNGTVTLNPVQTSDTVFYVPMPNTDEYLLLENRDSLLSDTAQMNPAFDRPPPNERFRKRPGLLIWHIDDGKVTSGMSNNSVNAGIVQGVALEQADGLNNLRSLTGNRGDTGDGYPGSTGNQRFSFSSAPSAVDNQNVFMGFAIDSITRIPSGANVPSPVTFRFTRRERSLFGTDRAGAVIKVNDQVVTSFDDVVPAGDVIDLDVVTPQNTNNNRSRLSFLAWSDGLASAHPVTSSAAAPDTVIASFSAQHMVNLVTAPSGGTVTSDLPGSPNLVQGVLVQEGLAVTLTATPGTNGTFIRWQGDTSSTNLTLVLPMQRPYSLTPVFSGSVSIVTHNAVNALLGVSCGNAPCLTSQELTFLDQAGNNDQSYNLGDFLAYADRAGLNLGSPEIQRVLVAPTVTVPVGGSSSRTRER